MSTTLSRGTKVHSRIYGNGIVLEQWGSWYACRGCYLELSPNQLACPECSAKQRFDENGQAPAVVQVSGHGVYDVIFAGGKIHPINRCRLTIRHGLIAA